MSGYKEFGFEDFVQELIEQGRLEGSALGIARQFVDKGEESLSDRQRYVFQREVVDEFVTKECSLCGIEISWEEMTFAYDNSGHCAHCEHLLEND